MSNFSGTPEKKSRGEHTKFLLQIFWSRFFVAPFVNDAGLQHFEYIEEVYRALARALPLLACIEQGARRALERYTALYHFVDNYPKFEAQYLNRTFLNKKEIEDYFYEVLNSKDKILELLFGEFKLDQTFPMYIKTYWKKLVADEDNFSRFLYKIKEALEVNILD